MSAGPWVVVVTTSNADPLAFGPYDGREAAGQARSEMEGRYADRDDFEATLCPLRTWPASLPPRLSRI